MPVAEICRKAGISQATYFNWKKKYNGSTKSWPLLGGLVVGLKVGFCHQPLIRTVRGIARDHVTFLGRTGLTIRVRDADATRVLARHVGAKLGNLRATILLKFVHDIALEALVGRSRQTASVSRSSAIVRCANTAAEIDEIAMPSFAS